MSSLLLLKSMLFAELIQDSKRKPKVKLKPTAKSRVGRSGNCRICYKEKGCIPIFNNSNHPDIPEEIKNFSGITVLNSGIFTKYMCQTCYDLLNGCIVFRDLCQKNRHLLESATERVVRNKRDESKEADTDEYNVPSPENHNDTEDIGCDKNEFRDCSSCNKQFLDSTTYNEHLHKCKKMIKVIIKPPRTIGVGTKKKYLCDICGKVALSNANLQVHRVIHENVFPFKCDQCPYQGRTMDLLRVHKRSHLTDKPFKCSQCPKATTTSSNLAKHMRHVHSTTRPHKCTYCDKGFSYLGDMKRHVKDIHLRQGTVKCDVCFKKFNTKKILQGHRLKIHKIRGERQGRLPAYLQCQVVEPTDSVENNLNNYEPT